MFYPGTIQKSVPPKKKKKLSVAFFVFCLSPVRAKDDRVLQHMVNRKRIVEACYLVAVCAAFSGPGDKVRAAQYNTSAASSWIQLADDPFSGRNGGKSARG